MTGFVAVCLHLRLFLHVTPFYVVIKYFLGRSTDGSGALFVILRLFECLAMSFKALHTFHYI